MNAELVKNVGAYAKTRDGAFTLLLAGGVWLAGEVKHHVERVDAKLDRLGDRITSIERNLNLDVAQK